MTSPAGGRYSGMSFKNSGCLYHLVINLKPFSWTLVATNSLWVSTFFPLIAMVWSQIDGVCLVRSGKFFRMVGRIQGRAMRSTRVIRLSSVTYCLIEERWNQSNSLVRTSAFGYKLRPWAPAPPRILRSASSLNQSGAFGIPDQWGGKLLKLF